MIRKGIEIKKITEFCPESGAGKLYLTKMSDCYEIKPQHLRTFALAELEPGAEVGYHTHTGESESYYILSGQGIYNDNGKSTEIASGDLTYTPSGEGHALKNAGDGKLVFITLIILE